MRERIYVIHWLFIHSTFTTKSSVHYRIYFYCQNQSITNELSWRIILLNFNCGKFIPHTFTKKEHSEEMNFCWWINEFLVERVPFIVWMEFLCCLQLWFSINIDTVKSKCNSPSNWSLPCPRIWSLMRFVLFGTFKAWRIPTDVWSKWPGPLLNTNNRIKSIFYLNILSCGLSLTWEHVSCNKPVTEREEMKKKKV